MNSFNLKTIYKSLKTKAEWFSLREVFESTNTHVSRDGNPEVNNSNSTHGVMVEILMNGQFGYSATNELNLKGLQNALDKAESFAINASKYSLVNFDTSVRPTNIGNYKSNAKNNINDISIPEINNLLISSNQYLKYSDRIICTTGFAMMVDSRHKYICSNGSNIEQDFQFISLDFSATGQHNGIIQKRTDHGMLARSYQIGTEFIMDTNIEERCMKIGEQADELLFAEDCPTENMDLVLAPDQMMLQIHESVGHPLEVDRILGDERNYAGWSFIRKNDFNKLQYGSKLMNITFDPKVNQQFASYKYDDSGLEAKKEYIIKDGLLLKGLGGTESQFRSKLDGVANFRSSSWNRPPIDRMANLNLEPGNSTFNEIISNIENGVYMESNRSWSIDDYRNKFQFGCEYGKLIKNGKITKTLRNPNYRGITTPFWNNLKSVGDKSTLKVYGTPYCGKGEPNQIIRVGHASPVCHFEKIDVLGGI
jgi:predicted Zn-dependent protease